MISVTYIRVMLLWMTTVNPWLSNSWGVVAAAVVVVMVVVMVVVVVVVVVVVAVVVVVVSVVVVVTKLVGECCRLRMEA